MSRTCLERESSCLMIYTRGTKCIFLLCCILGLQTVVVDHEFGTAAISATATGFQQPHVRAARAYIPVTALGGFAFPLFISLHFPGLMPSVQGWVYFLHTQMRQLHGGVRFIQQRFYTASWLFLLSSALGAAILIKSIQILGRFFFKNSFFKTCIWARALQRSVSVVFLMSW